jgi:hypothetical protein
LGQVATDTGGDLGLGEPWNSLVKASGALLVLILIALWREWLFRPGVVKNLRTQLEDQRAEHVATLAATKAECVERLNDMRAERDRLQAEQKELTTWLQQEAIPLVSRSTAVIEKLASAATK